ncbi:cytochrome P450 [Deinococcus sp.]|uniref:cytochrome P450 n=1 Tax=Deinococcus sp. TaxID=47478 RepID=UPI0025BD621C|nr:cytochrome P450 [Deinococcus sp.]
MNTLPVPRAEGRLGHLPRWGAEPLPLLEEGAALAGRRGLFGLQLGLRAVVGFSPEWNRKLLGDLETFRSVGSFSRLVPHLAGGIILTDAPEHAGRRRELNPGFSRPEVGNLVDAMRVAMPPMPRQYDALAWADLAALKMLNAAYFSGEFDEGLLHTFLAPLRRAFPVPILPQPLTRCRVDAELRRLAQRRRSAPRPDLLTFLLGVPDGLTEARISLAAAHDTVTHALAYCLWYAACCARWPTPQQHPALLKEVLRLYPPGWMGSRRVSRDLVWEGIHIPKGTLALYAPYLSGRDPVLWDAPRDFQPERWASKPPAWAYLPFGGGERTCLGMHLAQSLILTVLAQTPPLRVRWGRPTPQPGLTLGPRGPLWLEHR